MNPAAVAAGKPGMMSKRLGSGVYGTCSEFSAADDRVDDGAKWRTDASFPPIPATPRARELVAVCFEGGIGGHLQPDAGNVGPEDSDRNFNERKETVRSTFFSSNEYMFIFTLADEGKQKKVAHIREFCDSIQLDEYLKSQAA
ncbi:hypothetical protein AURDEDRAFT_164250 [Auricularia subglabra TFB-10046 SS5]|nr:hypothetical protein AURDEDRAFT_164250 [Auricularia subglabra TFB-10046 SS5]